MFKKLCVLVLLTFAVNTAFASYVQAPGQVSKGFTGATSFTAYSVVLGGTTSTGALQNVSGLGTAGFVLTSNGAAAAPTWQASASGTVTAVTASSPLASSGGTTPNITIQNATTSQTGALTSTDWNTFNDKANLLKTVTDGGDTAYAIGAYTASSAVDYHVRSGTTLTAQRTYTLPACTTNIGEIHEVKNTPTQTFNLLLAGNGGDTVDGNANVTLFPGDSIQVICAVSGAWDIE